MSGEQAGARDEGGFTLVELMVVLSILGVVMAICFNVLISVTENEALQQARIQNQEEGRVTMTRLARDIRSANPMFGQATSAVMGTQIDLQLGDATAPEFIRWKLDDKDLVRQTLASKGGPVVQEHVALAGLYNTERSIQLFRYFDDAVQELDTLTETAADIANCAIRVQITMASAPDPIASAFIIQSDVQLRNRLPGGIGC